MKKTLCTSICIAMLGWAGTAAAAPVNFYEMQGGFVFDSTNTSKASNTWIFDLDNDPLFSAWNGSGSDPYGPMININPEDKITSAWIEISFYDNDYILNPNTGNERVAFREFASLVVDGTSLFVNREIDDGFFHRNIQASFLNDHQLEVSLTALSGDFEVYGVLLGGAFRDKPPLNDPVPEPATMLLFGTGLAGLAAAGRKK